MSELVAVIILVVFICMASKGGVCVKINGEKQCIELGSNKPEVPKKK